MKSSSGQSYKSNTHGRSVKRTGGMNNLSTVNRQGGVALILVLVVIALATIIASQLITMRGITVSVPPT